MQTATFEHDKSTEFPFGDLAARAAEGKELIEDALDVGLRKAQRVMRKGREAGEDCLDETTHYIKHHPWQSVGIAAGVGTFVGLLCGWACTRS